jgi:hypothetical protein
MLLTLQLKLKIKKRPHSFNHNCNHYSLSEGEWQQKKALVPDTGKTLPSSPIFDELDSKLALQGTFRCSTYELLVPNLL